MYQIYCVCSKISKDTMQDQICHIFAKQILKLTARTCLEYRIVLVNVTRIWSNSRLQSINSNLRTPRNQSRFTKPNRAPKNLPFQAPSARSRSSTARRPSTPASIPPRSGRSTRLWRRQTPPTSRARGRTARTALARTSSRRSSPRSPPRRSSSYV